MAIIGAILGDIAGSKWEFNRPKDLDYEHIELFQDDSYYTDDTVLSVATKYALENEVSFKDAYNEFGNDYIDCGYGDRFFEWLIFKSNTYYKVLNAKDFGIPQNRERLYLIIVNKDIDNGKFEFPEGFESNIVMYDILEDEENVDTKYYVDSAKEKEALQEMIDSGKLRKDYSNTVRWGGRGSLDRHQWDLIQIPDKEQS